MRFLADESCDFLVARTLRSLGHDVLVVSEFQQRSVDEELMHLATAENRILLTEDKDFGWLTFVREVQSPGVVLFRFPANARRLLEDTVRWLINQHANDLAGAFVVVQPGQARIQRR
jgi:predicted nuclease of predicted toxin-antitoxin system